MDLQQEWQNMSTEIGLAKNLNITAAPTSSTGLLQTLLTKLNWKLRWIRIISLPILVAALFTHGDLKLVLIIAFLCFELGRLLSWRIYKKIKTNIDYTANIKQVLQENVRAIRSFIKIETVWSFVFLPLSAPAGYLVFNLVVHKRFEAAFVQPYFFYKLGACALFGIPGIILTQKANHSLFAAHLKDLQQKIDQLAD